MRMRCPVRHRARAIIITVRTRELDKIVRELFARFDRKSFSRPYAVDSTTRAPSCFSAATDCEHVRLDDRHRAFRQWDRRLTSGLVEKSFSPSRTCKHSLSGRRCAAAETVTSRSIYTRYLDRDPCATTRVACPFCCPSRVLRADVTQNRFPRTTPAFVTDSCPRSLLVHR